MTNKRKTTRVPSTGAHTAGVLRALKRAAARAREIAIRTETPLVIYRNGRVEKIFLAPGQPES
jgi:hypothetical protein